MVLILTLREPNNRKEVEWQITRVNVASPAWILTDSDRLPAKAEKPAAGISKMTRRRPAEPEKKADNAAAKPHQLVLL